ncbi:sigma factor-binding protein Crl [Photobacterium sp.]|uniref:sigma factor-binding protein Crl n=1 Tax=Photobacterium sp. TaxID=660 RepID=UPI00299F0446|nr:sigma factor-binding protein Crl [Photobacterium sp.]MDX1302419.1 sigma factor-binding protein Crl [Photobacterium sp.]
MTTNTVFPPHGRLMTKLTALGPYLRQQHSKEGEFFFDCLASCISAKKSPEEREFWGWWLVLTATDSGFEYRYYFGRYDSEGNWNQDKVPAKHAEAVVQTIGDFYSKLTNLLQEECGLEVTAADDLKEAALGSMA